jgi:hypothetical protein
MYAGELRGTAASFLAARIEAHTAMIADFLGSSTEGKYHIRFLFAIAKASPYLSHFPEAACSFKTPSERPPTR